ncbi:hypothetical protein [Granulosicoccus antarcticus]|uniref:hypothetical protein n=1 Tax=Granulosicoccus antarcticus TaxID=437505 RepID=UPI0012FD7030|nr:hypothetical protein [Granulosicoccus antarcticus]
MTSSLIISTASWANPTVDGDTISWPDDGWYQVQDASTFESLCEGGLSCTVPLGLYNVINHTSGVRYEGIEVAGSDSDPTDSLVPTVDGDIITWPDNGWYQVQNAETYESLCEGGLSCTLPPGLYNVINHTSGVRYEGIEVAGSDSGPTDPTDAELIESMASNSFLNFGLETLNVDELGIRIGESDSQVFIMADLDQDNNDELILRANTQDDEVGLLPGNASLNALDIDELIPLSYESLPESVLDFNGDGNADKVSSLLRGVDRIYPGFTLRLDPGLPSNDNSGLDGQNGIRIDGVEPGQLGGALRPVGDVNGDGFEDLAILPNGQVTPAGRAAHILYGRMSFPVGQLDISQLQVDNYAEQLIADDGFEFENIIALGDVDGNGFDDFALTYSEQAGSGNTAIDTVIVFGSSARAAGNVDTVANGLENGSLARLVDMEIRHNVGDIDADGLLDVVIDTDELDFFSGVKAILNPSQLTGGQSYSMADVKAQIVLVDIDGQLINLHSAGDVDGDGFDDLLIEEFAVGNHVLVYAGTLAGHSKITVAELLEAGSPLLKSDTPYVSSSSANGEYVSVSYAYDVEAGGDLNGDGFDDLVIQLSSFFRDTEQDELMILPGGPR